MRFVAGPSFSSSLTGYAGVLLLCCFSMVPVFAGARFVIPVSAISVPGDCPPEEPENVFEGGKSYPGKIGKIFPVFSENIRLIGTNCRVGKTGTVDNRSGFLSISMGYEKFSGWHNGCP